VPAAKGSGKGDKPVHGANGKVKLQTKYTVEDCILPRKPKAAKKETNAEEAAAEADL